MLKRFHQICSWLVLGIGLLHTVATFAFYKRLSEAAVWFAGAGLAGIFIGLLNLRLWENSESKRSLRILFAANLLFAVWLSVAFAVSPRGLPQLFVLGSGWGMILGSLWQFWQGGDSR